MWCLSSLQETLPTGVLSTYFPSPASLIQATLRAQSSVTDRPESDSRRSITSCELRKGLNNESEWGRTLGEVMVLCGEYGQSVSKFQDTKLCP